MKARSWIDVIETLREHMSAQANIERALHSGKRKNLQDDLSITIDRENKIFHDKTKFKQYLSTNFSSFTKDNRWKIPT